MMSTMCAEFFTQAPVDGVLERRLERLRRAAVVSRADVGTCPLVPTSRSLGSLGSLGSLAEHLAVHPSRRRHAG
jgi:hypothetical protein